MTRSRSRPRRRCRSRPGTRGSSAHTRGFDRVPSAARSNATRSLPVLSAATSVDPSAVTTSPFAIRSPPTTSRTEPSGSTRSSGARSVLRAAVEVEAELADERVAGVVDDHVVDLERGDAPSSRPAPPVARRPPSAAAGGRASTRSARCRRPRTRAPRGRRARGRRRRRGRRAATRRTSWACMSETHSAPSCQRGPSRKARPVHECRRGARVVRRSRVGPGRRGGSWWRNSAPARTTAPTNTDATRGSPAPDEAGPGPTRCRASYRQAARGPARAARGAP